jgi:hypothetical protein
MSYQKSRSHLCFFLIFTFCLSGTIDSSPSTTFTLLQDVIISFLNSSNGYLFDRVGEDAGKKEPSYTVGGNVD